jgi:hypothetical protein
MVLVLSAASPALAEHDDEALLRQGVELRRAGKDEQALEVFQRAYRMRPTPRAQAQAGFAEQALGRWLDAERDITEALASSGDPWVAKNAATLRQSLAVVAQHLGNLQILGSPAGATVKFDDRPVGALPMDAPARVTAGEVLVAVSAPGHVQIQRKLTVAAGAMVRETFTLPVLQNDVPAASNVDGASRPAPPPVKSAAGGHPVETVAASGAGARPDSAGRGLSSTQGWGIAVASAGVVAVGVGAVFASQAISKNNESKSGCDGNVCDATGKQERLDAIAAGNRATAAMVIGGALVATGAVLFLVGRREGPSAEATALRVAPVITPDSLAVVGALSF